MEQFRVTTKTVVVDGGGANLYKISDAGGRYTAYKVAVNLLLPNSRNSIGSARTLDDAVTLIRSHSGKEIQSIG